jgi:TDG/mug DNA glycosylase family protein
VPRGAPFFVSGRVSRLRVSQWHHRDVPPVLPLKFPRPTKADLEAARDRTIEDVVGPGLRVLFCGINPGLWSGASGFHFARPGNRFWKVLHLAGFTARVLDPSENRELLRAHLGITNLVRRTTAAESDLRREEFVEGAARLRALVADCRPAWLAMVGIGAYRVGFGDAKASVGRQEARLGDTGLWVLPNPSGLNANYQLPALTAAFRELRETACS